MAALANTAEGGSNGTTVTTANSGAGSGDAWSAITGTGGTVIFDTTHPAHGSLGYKIVNAASTAKYVQWTITADTAPHVRFYYYLAANPPSGAATNLFRFMNSTTNVLIMRVSSTGVIDFTDVSGSSVAASGAGAWPLNENVRVEIDLVCNATTGSFTARFYHQDGTTPFLTLTASNLNTSTQVDGLRFGVINAAGSATTMWFDTVAYDSVAQPGAFVKSSLVLDDRRQRRNVLLRR